MTTMNSSATTVSRAVQSDNYKGLTARKLSEAEQRVLHAVRLGHARGQANLSLTEICLLMEEQQGRRVSPNQISGRVTSLVASGRLARAEPRACSVTGAKCQPVFAVARQAELGIVQAKSDISSAARARAAVERRAAVSQQAEAAPASGMPPEVRAKLAAIKLSAERGR